MENSRTVNVARNMAVSLFFQTLNLLLKFICRTVFIMTLGIEYLGVNGLFVNVLSILSFAELGIGNAIIYNMYKPLAEQNKEKIKSLMALYSKAYKIIALIIALIGISVMPFLDIIIKSKPNIHEDIRFLYLLFLSNTVISYLYAFKNSIITADQKDYIVVIYRQVFFIIQTVIQTVLLLITHNFVLYLLVQIGCTLLTNIFISKKSDRLYPYIKKEIAEPLESAEIAKIFKEVKALFIYRIGTGISKGIDNIIISALIGIGAVGLASNYVLVISAFTMLLGQLVGAFTASVGNLNAIESEEKKELVFNKIFFINAWLFGFCSVGLFLLLNPFIEIWIGKEYLLPLSVLFALVLNFYISNVHFTAYTYLITMGLFVKGRVGPLIEACLNIFLSIILGKKFGLAGVYLATSIATLLSIGIIDPVLVYKLGFKQNPIKYYIKYYGLGLIFLLMYFITSLFVKLINFGGVLAFIVQVIVVTIVFNSLMFVIFRRTTVFKELKAAITIIIKRKLGFRTL
jgi:O-antigen/teichoic acid export membrane protein